MLVLFTPLLEKNRNVFNKAPTAFFACHTKAEKGQATGYGGLGLEGTRAYFTRSTSIFRTPRIRVERDQI